MTNWTPGIITTNYIFKDAILLAPTNSRPNDDIGIAFDKFKLDD